MERDGLVAILCLMVAFVIGGLTGNVMGERDVRREAVKNNAAEWRVDSKTGETKFVWKGSKDEKCPSQNVSSKD